MQGVKDDEGAGEGDAGEGDAGGMKDQGKVKMGAKSEFAS